MGTGFSPEAAGRAEMAGPVSLLGLSPQLLPSVAVLEWLLEGEAHTAGPLKA